MFALAVARAWRWAAESVLANVWLNARLAAARSAAVSAVACWRASFQWAMFSAESCAAVTFGA